MSKTETCSVPTTTDALTVTVPSDHTPCGALAVVLHTAVEAIASTPLSAPVAGGGPTGSEMTPLPDTHGVQVTSADQL
jgi:hypothetical protein